MATLIERLKDDIEKLELIANRMRLEIEVRNRQHLKRLYKNCFLGSDAVSWIVRKGLANSRSEAVELGKLLQRHKFIRHATDAHSFKDSYQFYRFHQDESEFAELSHENAGHGNAIKAGAGECAWTFVPHTAHNSLVLGAALAHDLELATGTGNQVAFTTAVNSLRERVRQACNAYAQGWNPVRETTINGSRCQIFRRSRPRGEFQTTKTVGNIPVNPRKFMEKFVDLSERKNWEDLFKDGVVVDVMPLNPTRPSSPPEVIPAPSVPKSPSTTPLSPSQHSSLPTTGLPVNTNAIPIIPQFTTSPGLSAAHLSLPPNLSPLGLSGHEMVERTSSGSDDGTLVYGEESKVEFQDGDESVTGQTVAALPTSPPLSPTNMDQAATSMSPPVPAEAAADPTSIALKWATCKRCGRKVRRNIEEIEQHSEICEAASVLGNALGETNDDVSSTDFLGGIARDQVSDPVLRRVARPRIIYRVANAPSVLFNPREVASFQDWFEDPDGACYVYEISVCHRLIRGTPGYVTAEILLLAHCARPIPNDNHRSELTIISQVDPKTNSPGWISSFLADSGRFGIAGHLDAFQDVLDDEGRESAASAQARGSHMTPPDAPTSGQRGSLIPADMTDVLMEEDESRRASDDHGVPPPPPVSVTLSDFDLLAVLGRGGFGKVMQVRYRQSGEVYAMKVLRKKELCRRKQVERTKTERIILSQVKHPFIVRLYFAFQNREKLYMVMDFVQGGDMFTLMRKVGRMKESWVRFYSAQMALALDHLHQLDIIYRDLKPENILVERDGFLKLTDFGLSRHFEVRPAIPDDSSAQLSPEEGAVIDPSTKSFCGTEQYMAPEMLLQKGHTYVVDWWCLGLVCHELMACRHPFMGSTHIDTLRAMVHREPNLDARLSGPARQFLRELLAKEPTRRLGHTDAGGFEVLKSHAFFSELDWDALYHKRVQPPYVPTIRDARDVSNFETAFTDETPADSMARNPDEKQGGLLDFFNFTGSKKPPKADDVETRESSIVPDDTFGGFSYTDPSSIAAQMRK